jgi:hypothetical protein
VVVVVDFAVNDDLDWVAESLTKAVRYQDIADTFVSRDIADNA